MSTKRASLVDDVLYPYFVFMFASLENLQLQNLILAVLYIAPGGCGIATSVIPDLTRHLGRHFLSLGLEHF